MQEVAMKRLLWLLMVVALNLPSHAFGFSGKDVGTEIRFGWRFGNGLPRMLTLDADGDISQEASCWDFWRGYHTPVPPGGPISKAIEHFFPAGRTFGEEHDAIVDKANRKVSRIGYNVPTMPIAYVKAVWIETTKSVGLLEQAMRDRSGIPSGK
jgi:hypothetical protein